MTVRGILVIVLALCFVDSTRAQLSLTVSPTVGITSTSASFRQLGQLVLPAQAAGLSSSAGWSAGASIGIKLPVAPWISLLPHLGLSYATYGFTASEPTTFVINGSPVAGRIDHVYQLTSVPLEIGADVYLRLFDRLWLTAGADYSVPLSLYGTQDQTIAEPASVSFIDGSSTIRTADSAIPGSRPAPYLSVGVMFPISYDYLDIDLEVRYRTPLSSIVNSAEILPSSVLARITVAFPFGGDAEQSLNLAEMLPLPEYSYQTWTQTQPRLDTILPMPPVPDVFATCMIGFRSIDGAVVRTGYVTLTHELALVAEQHGGGLAQHRLDTVTVADPPAMVISPSVHSDDEIVSWAVTIGLRDTLITIGRGEGNVPASIVWECSSLSSSVLSQLLRDSAHVSVSALGRRGGIARSAPVTVHMRSEPIVRLIDTTQFIASLTGFEPNQTLLPPWCSNTISDLLLHATRTSRIYVTGKADGVGERDANERIARERALSAAAAIAPRKCVIQLAQLPGADSNEAVRGKDRGVQITVRQTRPNR